MALPQHLDQAASRLKEAAARIEEARQRAGSHEGLRDWMAALTDFAMALSDIQSFNNESVHEKLHALRERIGLREFPGSRRKGPA